MSSDKDTIAGALDLFGCTTDGTLTLLARQQNPTSIVVEATNSAIVKNGQVFRVPPDLLGSRLVIQSTSNARISLAWTEACGDRPVSFAAAPLRGTTLYVIVAQANNAQIDEIRLAQLAQVISALLAGGENTTRENSLSRRFGALINNLPAPLVFADTASLSVFINEPARLLLGLYDREPQADVVAAALSALVGEASPNQRERIAADPRARFAFEALCRDKFFLVDTSAIDENGLVGRLWLFSDITEAKIAQLRLEEMRRLLTITVENVFEGVALLDEEARLLVWNSSFVSILKLPLESVVRGTPYLALIDIVANRGDISNGAGSDVVDKAASSLRERREVELDVERTDGTKLTFRRITLEGGKTLLGVRDITKEREAQRLKDELISNVSHELRTPLTAISGSLAMLGAGMAGTLPSSAAQLVDVAHRNSVRLSRLVDDLLDMDKLRSGRVEFSFREVELRGLMAEAIEQNIPYGTKFGVLLELDDPGEPVPAHLDPDRILQVISNLLSNAVKFSPAGGVVTLRLRADDDTITISVIDRGRGMSGDFLKRLFDRFSQEGHVGNGQASSGLGLAISKSIVDHHSGCIEVSSMVGKGTEFRVILPRRAR